MIKFLADLPDVRNTRVWRSVFRSPERGQQSAPLAGRAAERFHAPGVGQDAAARAGFRCHLVSGHAQPGVLPDPGRHRHPADAVLPSFGPARLPGHEGPAVRRFGGSVSAQFTPLVGACHGAAGVRAHVQGVLPRRVSSSARIQLGHRRDAADGDLVSQLYRLPAAVGSTGVLGDHRRLEYYVGGAGDGRQKFDSLCWAATP